MSHLVSANMQQHGYRIIPANPFVDEVLDERSFKSFLDIPVETQRAIDIVDIFRKAEDTPPIVDQAHPAKCRCWQPFCGLDAVVQC